LNNFFFPYFFFFCHLFHFLLFYHMPTALSLGVIAALLVAAVVASRVRERRVIATRS